MKKVRKVLLVTLIGCCLLAGCGGTEEKAEEVKTEEVKEETKASVDSLDDGYWLIESMVMEGTEFLKEDIESIFGPMENVVALAFGTEGNLSGIFFDEHFIGNYTGDLKKFELEINGEKVAGAYTDEGKMELTLHDGSKLILLNQEEAPKTVTENPWFTYTPSFDGNQTSAMSNFMSYGSYLVEDGVMYGLTHSDSLEGGLGATSFKMKGDFPEIGETKLFDKRGRATYICKNEDYLYYIMGYNEICRVHTDGSGFEVLYEGTCDYLQIHEGRLYFADENYHVVSTDLDGKDLQKVVEKEVYYPYFIGSDWMVFQDDADDESMHLYNTTYKVELNITYMPTYCPILDGKYLYCVLFDGEVYNLARFDMSDPSRFISEVSENVLLESFYMIDDTQIYTSNNNSVEKENWKDLSDTKDKVAVVNAYVSSDYSIHHEFDENGLILYKYLMSKETSGGSQFK